MMPKLLTTLGLSLLLATGLFAQGGGQFNPGAGSSTATVTPGTPGNVSGAAVVSSGLMAYYRALPTETAAGLVDYSGNGRNATGTVGTAPTILAGTGGVSCGGAGAIILPAGVNTALTIQVLTSIAQTATINAAPVLSNNNGSGSTGSVGMIFISGKSAGIPGSAQVPPLVGAWRVQSIGGNPASFYAMGNNATGSNWTNAAVTMDTNDRIYMDGVEESYYNVRSATSAGQNASPYQICGSATGTGFNTYYTGTIKSVLFYNRVLGAAEVFQNSIAQCNDAIAAGFIMRCPNDALLTNYSADTVCRIAMDDDSMGNAAGGFLFNNGSFAGINLPTAGGACPAWDRLVSSRSGNTTIGAIGSEPRTIDKVIGSGAGENVAITWYGRNDGCIPTANAILNNMAALVWGRKNAGWYYSLPLNMADYTTGDTCKNNYNTAFRNYPWPDNYVDVGSDPLIGADGASTNTNIFSDGTHTTQDGQMNHIGVMVQRVLGRKFGNTTWQAATTYVAPALAAVATTAGSQTAHFATITFAATPANCLLGNTIVIAGVTPAGYNGTWWISTSTGTTVQYYINTTGLGAVTVQGTGVCPQQQDADLYQILNFGAGNYTLASCQGPTGMIHYIRNINAVASTIVPFGTETIDGAANLTIPAAPAIIGLVPVVTSSSTSGCIWKRTQ
jgi:hypothetical protein